MRNLLIATVALVLLASPALMPSARATYGGSGGYQSENRENQNTCPYQNDCFGRCGPGCSSYFGTAVTTQCQNHDQCIKDNRCAGKSNATSHLNCLTGSRGLGRAAWSVLQYHWDNYASKAKSNLISSWANVCSSC